MLANRLVLASCSIALMMLACDDGGEPDRAQGSLPIEAAPDSRNESETDGEPPAAEDDEEPPVTPESEEPDEIGLSCAVKELLVARCQGCHAADAKNGTPLLTRDNLLAEAKKDPTAKVIERVLLRVTATDKPMPPVGKGEPLSADEVSTLRSWFEQGALAGRCDGP
jgi:hypothetical protein